MDIASITTMALSGLRQGVRDRSVLIFGLAVPLALMFVFNLLFSGLAGDEALEPVTVGVVADPEDPVASGYTQVLANVDLDITTQSMAGDAIDAAIEDDDIGIAVVFPDQFAAAVQSGGSPTVEVVTEGGPGLEQQVVIAITQGYVDRLQAATRAATAAGMGGLDQAAISDVAGQVATATPSLVAQVGEASDEQLDIQGYLVAGQTALFMFFTVGFGVLSYLAERDQGTLTRLLSMPIPPGSIIMAKTVVSFVLGLASTTVLLGAGSLLFGVDFGNLLGVAVLVVVAVAATTSLVLLVTKVARTAEQAQITNSILGIGMGVLGGAFFPIGGDGALASLSDLTPPAAFIRGLGITSGGGGVADLAAPLAVLGGFLVAALVLWVVLPDRGVEA